MATARSASARDVARLKHVLSDLIGLGTTNLEGSVTWKALQAAGVYGFKSDFIHLTEQDRPTCLA